MPTRCAPQASAAVDSSRHVLLVSDNRDNANWGSRSTTMALLELLGRNGYHPSDTVYDAEVRTPTPVARWSSLDSAISSGVLAGLTAKALGRGERTRRVMGRYLGITDDVSDDPTATVSRWVDRPRKPFSRWIEAVRTAELVVINGEGSMIFTQEPRREQRFHLAIMQLALSNGVPYMYLNALASDPPSEPRNQRMYSESARLLRSARLVTSRDPDSLAYFEAMSSDIPAMYVPDAVFTWFERLNDPSAQAILTRPEYLVPYGDHPAELGEWRFDKPYLLLGGSSEAAKDPSRARASYGRLARHLAGLGLPLYLTASCTGDAFLEGLASEMGLPLVPATTNVWAAAAILANAEVVVTGRYHPSILAGLGGTPGILLGADSHKTTSVQKMLGYPEIETFPVFPDEAACAAIVARVKDLIARRDAWSTQILSHCAMRAQEARGLGSLVERAIGPEAS